MLHGLEDVHLLVKLDLLQDVEGSTEQPAPLAPVPTMVKTPTRCQTVQINLFAKANISCAERNEPNVQNVKSNN